MKKTSALLLPLMLLVGCNGNGGAPIDSSPQNPFGDGPAAVSLSKNRFPIVAGDLGSAGNYVILSKTGVTDVTGSAIDGNVGVSPAAASYITGFGLIAHSSNTYSTSATVVNGGRVYAANYAAPTPSKLTTAISSMQTAYTDAAGRSNPDFTELYSGEIGSQTLVPGLYKWSSTVSISNDVTISGTATDVWIFQIAGNLTMASAKNVILLGGALPENIYWQVAGSVTVNANSQFSGIILGKTAINFLNGASLDGRALAQTAVTLNDNDVTQP